MLRPTLERHRRIFGRLHLVTQRTTRSLASSLRDRRFLPEAEALSREALDIGRALYGDNHVNTYDSTEALAVLLERKGDFADAESVARTAVAQGERLFGEENLNTWLALRTLGGTLLAQEKVEKAERALLSRSPVAAMPFERRSMDSTSAPASDRDVAVGQRATFK
jgi:hypothetical protein